MIRAGTMSELHRREGDWLFVDLGFSRNSKTCGYLDVPASQSEMEPRGIALTYGGLTGAITDTVRREGQPLHLVLEAPLSAAFSTDGNPVGRSIEKQENLTRYWYVGLGCSVLVASLYLLKEIVDANPAREIRLFEGLVSFKNSHTPSNHIADVDVLKAVVWSGGAVGGSFSEPAPLPGNSDARLTSTLSLLGLDPTPPPIIQGIAR